jgi:hypothetical protein
MRNVTDEVTAAESHDDDDDNSRCKKIVRRNSSCWRNRASHKLHAEGALERDLGRAANVHPSGILHSQGPRASSPRTLAR